MTRPDSTQRRRAGSDGPSRTLRRTAAPGSPVRGSGRSSGRRTYLVLAAVVLVALTGFVAVRTLGEGPGSTDLTSPASAAQPGPVVGEAPVGGSFDDVDIPTAELPGGGDFPVRGRQTWRVVPGSTPQFGTGRVFTYTVEIEDGATVAEGDSAFATAVDATLDDPRSWVGSGQIALRRIDAGVPDFRVSLTSQLTTREQCGYTIRYESSCWQSDLGRVLINGARWVRGAGAFDGQLGLYRQYAINHEVGHVFRNGHVPCGGTGQLAPVMMQQSFGVSDDYLSVLTEANPQGIQIPRDGRTCRPNPWPFPQGGPFRG